MEPRYVEHMKAVLMLKGIAPRAKLVLLKIAERADHNGGNAWPSYATLATAGCCSRRHVIRIIDNLVEAGYLTCRTPSRGGRSKTNTFAISLDKVRKTVTSDVTVSRKETVTFATGKR